MKEFSLLPKGTVINPKRTSLSANASHPPMHTLQDHRRVEPFISVICPVYNSTMYLPGLVRSLLGQHYPRDRYEIVFVDNGSTDGTYDELSLHPVTVLSRNDIRSSYAARNRGLQIARGEIIAFTDSDCTPQPDWLSSGIIAMDKEPSTDLVAGRVRFVFPNHQSVWHVYDSLTNMDNEISVRRGHAKTANLFVRRAVIDQVGLFPEHVVSGGDVEWTKRAVRAGFRLKYCDNAVVEHPTRGARETIIKAFRVGRGVFGRKQSMNYAFLDGSTAFLVVALKPLLPLIPFSLRPRMRTHGDSSLWLFLKLCAVGHVVRAVTAMGLVFEAYRRLFVASQRNVRTVEGSKHNA